MIWQSLNTAWSSKITLARKAKKRFNDDARFALEFYGTDEPQLESFGLGPKTASLLSGSDAEGVVTINKVSEAVQLYLPVLYHRNPMRQVNPRRVVIPEKLRQLIGVDPAGGPKPEDELRAALMNHYLNYTPHELNLREHSRMAVLETIIKGRGVLWCELHDPPDGLRMVGSFFVSVDDLLIDPDAEDVASARWIARRRREPHWVTEDKMGQPSGSLKKYCQSESYNEEGGRSDSDRRERRRQGGTNDLIEYYEVYSLMGAGGWLSGVTDDVKELDNPVRKPRYLAICPGADQPLNIPTGLDLNDEADFQIAQDRMEWPTPFHKDRVHPWPFSELDFHSVLRSAWPQSMMKPVMGQQCFINWFYRHAAQKIKTTSRDFILTMAGLEKEVRDAIDTGGDLACIAVNQQQLQGRSLRDFVEFLQHPPWNSDIFKVGQMMEESFERGSGLTELMYGQTSSQYRSASEAEIKAGQMNVRPDYMTERVEEWATRVAAKEGLACRYHLRAQDVAGVFGEKVQDENDLSATPYTDAWMQLVYLDDFAAAAEELEYRIEAGSSRKPNRQRDAANIDESAQVLLPQLMQVWQTTGDPAAVNAWLEEWAKTRDFDVSKFKLPPVGPAAAPAPAQGQPPPDQQGQQGMDMQQMPPELMQQMMQQQMMQQQMQMSGAGTQGFPVAPLPDVPFGIGV